MSGVACHICRAQAMPPAVPLTWGRCATCGTMLFAANGGPKVAVVHGSEAICAHIGAALARQRMHPLALVDARKALDVMRREEVSGLVLDVGLESIPFFELIGRIREDAELADTKIVLVAAVYNKTAYKRRPSSLYGADDYVEEHHVGDHLPERLGKLLGVAVQGHPSFDELETVNAEIERAERLRALAGPARIMAMAQRIVADIALYMEKEVNDARSGTIGPNLAAALEEGRRVLRALSGGESIAGDPIGVAFDEVRRWPRSGT